MKDLLIRDLDKNPVTYNYFINKLKEALSKGFKIYIGTDSQMSYETTTMVCAVCYYKKGFGGNAFYTKERVSTSQFNSLRQRMFAEAFKSIETAFEIQEILGCKIEVHLDIGSDPKRNKTSKFEKELTNMVMGQGFSCQIKPKSWASDVADWFTKS